MKTLPNFKAIKPNSFTLININPLEIYLESVILTSGIKPELPPPEPGTSSSAIKPDITKQAQTSSTLIIPIQPLL